MIVPKAVQDYFAAWYYRDTVGMLACFCSSGTYSDPVLGQMLRGQAIATYASRLWTAFPDFRLRVERIAVSADRVVAAEWRMIATHTGSICGLPSSRRAVDLSGVSFIEMEADKLASVTAYFDGRALPEQLGRNINGQSQRFGPVALGGSIHVQFDAGIEDPRAQDCLRRRGLFHDTPPLDIEDRCWPVKLTTLGGFEIKVNDERLVFSRKAPRKVMALLKAIIAYGGRSVPEGRLTDALWPDEEADAGHETFAVNLHRLRKLIGNNAVILQERRVTLDAHCCWVDAWAFERLLTQAESTGTATQRIALTEKALTLYRGAFLPVDPDEPWTLCARERLRTKFIRHAAFIGQHLANAGQWQEATEYYLRGIEVDNLAEEFYQGAMRCYAHLHRYTEGLAIYRRLQRTLSLILGIAPSPASQALYQRLRTEAPHSITAEPRLTGLAPLIRPF